MGPLRFRGAYRLKRILEGLYLIGGVLGVFRAFGGIWVGIFGVTHRNLGGMERGTPWLSVATLRRLFCMIPFFEYMTIFQFVLRGNSTL